MSKCVGVGKSEVTISQYQISSLIFPFLVEAESLICQELAKQTRLSEQVASGIHISLPSYSGITIV